MLYSMMVWQCDGSVKGRYLTTTGHSLVSPDFRVRQRRAIMFTLVFNYLEATASQKDRDKSSMVA